jgi:hypothetical protein
MGIPDGGTADRNSALINPEGVTLEEVYSAVSSLNPDFDVRVVVNDADLWLWPRWYQWEMLEGGAAQSEDGETDDETLIRVNHELGLSI